MSNDFTISEFLIDKSEQLTYQVADKILLNHVSIIQPIRDIMQCPIWPSENSGYRSIQWEKLHGRSGNSQHCFRESGATDYTCELSRLNELFELLKASRYMRVCLYPTFIHCDHFGFTKRAFTCTGKNSNGWVLV